MELQNLTVTNSNRLTIFTLKSRIRKWLLKVTWCQGMSGDICQGSLACQPGQRLTASAPAVVGLAVNLASAPQLLHKLL